MEGRSKLRIQNLIETAIEVAVESCEVEGLVSKAVAAYVGAGEKEPDSSSGPVNSAFDKLEEQLGIIAKHLRGIRVQASRL